MRAPDPLLTERELTTKRRDRALGLAPQERGTRVDKGRVLGYSWFRVDGSFVNHPKVFALKAELGEPLADAYVLRLWSWVHQYAQTGHVAASVTGQLEAVLGWRGEPGRLIQSLTEVGLLEPTSAGLLVHDWPDYQAVFAKKAKKDAAKKRQRRRRDRLYAAQAPSRVTATPTRRDETRRDETRLLFPADGGSVAKSPPTSVAKSPPDPRHAPLVAELCDAYLSEIRAPYAFQGRDAKAVSQLLALTRDPEEVMFRWVTALRREGFPKVRTLPELVTNWNHFPAIAASEADSAGGGAGRNGGRL